MALCLLGQAVKGERAMQSTRTPGIRASDARAVIQHAQGYGVYAANVAASNAVRALANQALAAAPKADAIQLGAADAQSVFDLVCASAQHPASLNPNGTPKGADRLGFLAKRAQVGGGLTEKMHLKPVAYARNRELAYEDGPPTRYIPVTLTPEFGAELEGILQREADAVLAGDATLSAQADLAAQRASRSFLGVRSSQVRHGGRFTSTQQRDLGDLSPAQRLLHDRAVAGARIGVAFGFGQVFDNARQRHGGQWGAL